MKHLLALIFACGILEMAQAANGPIRVLYLGKENTDSSEHAHVLMRELGRDAIWFDYATKPALVTADWVGKFDAVLLDASREAFPALAGVSGNRVVPVEFSGSERSWAEDGFLNGVKEKLLSAAGAERRKAWEAFLAQREPETREADPNIANYERRREAITLQHPFEVKGSVERTQVPMDMRLELFASHPDINKPIAFAWDEAGRLWVCEARDYPHGVNSSGEGNDSIKICADTDGDGRADTFTVFADKLNIPTSMAFARGGVVVTQPPRLLLLKDTDGDDRADTREVIMEGWGIGDTHAQANNLHWGYDNWLYGCVGYSGFRGTVGGQDLRFAQGTFRFKADGSSLEFLHQFSNNSWGQSANAAGDQFGGTANNAPLFYGGIPASVAPEGMRVMSAKKINVEPKAHTITPNYRQVDVFDGYTAAAGSAFIYSANVPPRLQGMAMVCEPTMKIISLMDVQRDGAGYVAQDGFNLVASSDEWMSPVFAEVGPDGAIWFSDWQNYIIQHNPTPSAQRGGYDARTGRGGAHENPLRNNERGRIYRVVWEKAPKPALTSLKGAAPARLVAALASDNQFWRLTAQRLLVEGKQSQTADALKNIVLANDGGVAAIHALWSLHGLAQLDDDTHRAALLAKDAALRRNAVRALSDDGRGQSLFFSSGVVSDPDLVTRLAALVKLAEFSTTKDIQTVVTRLARNPEHQSDEWLSEAIKILAKKHDTQPYREGPNLLPNPGFEVAGANGLPEGWTRRDYGNRFGNDDVAWSVVAEPGRFHGGKQALRCSSAGFADTSLYANVTLKPNAQYRLSGWVKGETLRGRLSFNDHIGRAETERVTRAGDWREVEVLFRSGEVTRTSINVLHVARGQGYFDDVKLCELLPADENEGTIVAGDAGRGGDIFHKHAAACVLCHQLKGEGSTVGPALDGIAARQTTDYIRESLLEPSKVLAKGYENLGLSPMPPMGDIFSAQELADVQAFLATLR